MPKKLSGDFNQMSADADGSSLIQEDNDVIKLAPDDSDINFNDTAKLNIVTDMSDVREAEEDKINEEKTTDAPASKKISSPANIKLLNEDDINNKIRLNSVWVSNIPPNVKAVDLKKIFNPIGKVSTVKILKNGKNFYGYACMDNQELATKCVTDLHNSLFLGQKISVSRDRPDLIMKNTDAAKKTVVEPKKTKSKKTKNEKNKATDSKHADNKKFIAADSEKNVANPKSKTASEKSNKDHSLVEDQQREIAKLHSKLASTCVENVKFERRLGEMKHLYNGLIVKYNSLKHTMDKMKVENRESRRRIALEKENFEKLRATEQKKLDTERAALTKELIETRKLKDAFKMKIESLNYRTTKRGRSPPARSSPRRRSSPILRGDAGLYREDHRPDKKYRRTETFSRDRTPPPPKYNSEAEKRHANDNNSVRTPYFQEGVKLKPPGTGYVYRPNQAFQQSQQTPKNTWLGAYPKEQRRGAPNHNQPNAFPNSRYGGPPGQHPGSSVVPPSRDGNVYYQQHW